MLGQADLKGYSIEMVKKINVFDRNIVWSLYLGQGKIYYPFYAGLDQVVGRSLGPLRRSGDQADLQVEFLQLGLHAPWADDLQATSHFSDLVGIAVERGLDVKAVAPKLAVTQKSPAEVSNPDKTAIPGAAYAQRLLDGGDQALHVITDPPDSEFTEVGEIFPNLRRIHIAGRGQLFRRYDFNAVPGEIAQDLEIHGQAGNSGFWDVFAFQNIPISGFYGLGVILEKTEKSGSFGALQPPALLRSKKKIQA